MPTPQWTAPSGLTEWGLDPAVNPRWFMVPHNPLAEKLLRLAFGKGKTARPVNERICAVRETAPDPADPDASFFWFTGKNPGNTRVEVFTPGRKVPETVLSVDVFAKRRISLVFHFVEDRGGVKTAQQPGILSGLVSDLNGIFENQANVTFETWEPGNQVKTHFHIVDAVYEGKDLTDKNKGTNWGELLGRREWEKVFRKHNDSRSLNIYFTPTMESAATNDNALPYVDVMNSSCIIEDGREPVDIILPHAIGRLLGCPLQERDRTHLMFWDATLRRTGDFINRACATQVHNQAT